MSVFNIVLELGDSDPAIIKRSQEALELFARDLESFSFPPQIHSIREALSSKSVREAQNEDGMTISTQDIQAFLLHCFTNVEIVQSKAVAHFLWDSTAEATPSGRPPTTAIDFLLQPIENQQIYIPQHQQFFLDIKLEKGETLVWRYQVGCGQELDFFALSCDSMFRSIKHRPHVPSSSGESGNESADEVNDHTEQDLPSASPEDFNQKLSESLDNFIASGSHRSIEKAPLAQNLLLHKVSIITASLSSAVGGWGRQVPFFSSVASTPLSPSTGCYQVQRKSALCRLLWDNSKSSLSGKHLEYCVQKVSESTMQVFGLTVLAYCQIGRSESS
jgi:hypothetical protein